jgi:hypothetical protein
MPTPTKYRKVKYRNKSIVLPAIVALNATITQLETLLHTTIKGPVRMSKPYWSEMEAKNARCP